MKKITLFLTLLLISAVGIAVIGKKNNSSNPSQEPREIREQRRAARQAAMEKKIDSIVLAKAFQFMPNTMQQEPAGRMQMLSNANFEVGIWNGAADIFIPYIKGITPPYRHTIINYTIPSMENYITEQTDDGWRVSFSTNLFSASTYTFIFEINSKFGTTTLNVKNQWYNTVQYLGTITQYY
ncbi:MAG: DUF4251 domain-containing protein [Rikenellaceae bacterium]